MTVEHDTFNRNAQWLLALVTDVHVGIGAAYDTTRVQLLAAVNDANDWCPGAMICMGDIGNNAASTVIEAKGIIDAARRRPSYVIPGNHDVEEVEAGVPLTAAVTDVFGAGPPWYTSFVLLSPDASKKARVLLLDCNYYIDDPGGELISPNHSNGDYIGEKTGSGVSYWRQLGSTQLTWAAGVLAADTTSNIVIFCAHYAAGGGTMVTDWTALADVLQTDGRPACGFGGHGHENGNVRTITSTDAGKSYSQYKVPSLSVAGCVTRVRLRLSGSTIAVDQMSIRNYVNQEWTFAAPFTVP